MTATASFKSDPFYAEMKSFLSTREDFGLGRCSASMNAKLALLKSSIEFLNQDHAKALHKPSAVELLKVKRKIDSLHKEISEKQDEILEDCVAIYNQAIAAPLPFVIGGSFLREARSIYELVNFGILATEHTSISKGMLPLITNTKTGSIFCPSPWTLSRNDAFMLGAARSNHTFYLAGSELTEDDVWDSDSNAMKTLGRELSILHVSGYEQVCPDEKIKDYGCTFVKNKAHTDDLSLEHLSTEVAKIKTAATILSFLKYTPE